VTSHDDPETATLAEMGARLQALLRNAWILHFAIDPDGIVTLFEGGGLAAAGWPIPPVVGRSVYEFYADTPWVLDGVRRALAGETASVTGEAWGRWFKVQYVPFPDPSTSRPSVIGFAMDITEQKETERRLRESEERFRALAEATFEAVAIHEKGKFLVANQSLARMFGHEDAAELVGRDVLEMSAPESRDLVRSRIVGGFEEPYEAVGRRQDGTTFHGEVHGKSIRYQGREVRVTAIRDITERKRAEEQLRHAALHDPLTGLPNRALFLDRLEHILAQAQQRPEGRPRLVGMLLLDIDRFKTVNDSLGHLVGDRLLTAIAGRLHGCLRSTDTLARFGGDEFTVLLEGLEDASEAVRVAERVQEVLTGPLEVDAYEVFTSASIGIVVAPADTYGRPEAVLRDADTAMYRAKALGRARYHLFDEAMHARVLGLLQLETELRRALEREELRLLYQPIVQLQRGGTVAFEALLRWEHPERGLLAPSAFLPLAEETGLLNRIGRWGLWQACRDSRGWRGILDRPVAVSVNLAGRQLFQPDFVGEVRRILEETGVAGAELQLEVTEGVLIEDAAAAVSLLSELRSLGIVVAIDDFGTGYSSLSQLHRLPVSLLKVDRSFVEVMVERPEMREMVRTIVSLGHILGLEVTAEGIETEAQCVALRGMGCECGQGYVFAPPLAPSDVEAWLRREARPVD
jgi:diguanylate cyclase (GGDEF)-like protein/PAS domain S-box-containing protein